MGIEYYIAGGQLHIDKKVFIKEMFRPDSVMKHLLNYQLNDHGKTRSLSIDKSATEWVIIDFNFVDKVKVGEDYHTLLEKIKKDLKDKIKGSIRLRIADYFEPIDINIDFNSEEDGITQQI